MGRRTGLIALLALLFRGAQADEQPPVQARAYHPPPPSVPVEEIPAQPLCPEKVPPRWREAQTIDGVEIEEELTCLPDNPFLVAAVVKGTNNVSLPTLRQIRLAPDAVVKGEDLDGDGDPDEITIKLEIAELNGASPDTLKPVYRYEIAPGITPAAITFVPKGRGPAVARPGSTEIHPLYRLPAPTIRVEEGDRVEIVLENTHYLPHSLHLQGVDHPFTDPKGRGNDGTPPISESPIPPGKRRVYRFSPRRAGTFLYLDLAHGHYPRLGLAGMLIVEENRPRNWLQTLNVGGGKVRHPSVAVRERFDQEYDLILGEIDSELSRVLQSSNDPRVIALRLHQIPLRDRSDRLLLNGKSFPYTLREPIVVEVNQTLLLHLVNGRTAETSLRFHGHRPVQGEGPSDLVALAPWERRDVLLKTANDGLHASGPGIWAFGSAPAAPGSDLGLLVYQTLLADSSPRLGGDLSPYLTEAFQKGKLPLWLDSPFGIPKGMETLLQPESPQPEPKPPVVRSPWLNFSIGLLLGLLGYLLFSNRERAIRLVRHHILKRG